MSVYSNSAVLYMPWTYSEMEDGRFNRILRSSLIACLLFSIIFTFLPLVIPETVIVEEPPRLVTLIFEKKPVMVNVRSARKTLGIKINRKDKTMDTKTKVKLQVINCFRCIASSILKIQGVFRTCGKIATLCLYW